MLRSLQGVQGQVKKLQDQAKLGIVGAMAGGREVMGGVHTALRGGMMLSAGDESLEKTFQTLIKFQAATDIFTGLKMSIHGTVSGLVNYTRAVKAAAAANATKSLIQGMSSAGGGAGAAGERRAGCRVDREEFADARSPGRGGTIATAIGGAAVALTAVGAAAVIASPKLETPGQVHLRTGRAAKKTAERIEAAEDARGQAREVRPRLPRGGRLGARGSAARAAGRPGARLPRAAGRVGVSGQARARFPTQPFAAAEQQRRAEILEQLHRQARRGTVRCRGQGGSARPGDGPGRPGPCRPAALLQYAACLSRRRSGRGIPTSGLPGTWPERRRRQRGR